MSMSAVNLANVIKVDLATQKGSVYDVISIVTKAIPAYAIRILLRIQNQYPEDMTTCQKLRINDKGRETPVANVATLVEIAWLLPGKKAASFKHKGASSAILYQIGCSGIMASLLLGFSSFSMMQRGPMHASKTRMAA